MTLQINDRVRVVSKTWDDTSAFFSSGDEGVVSKIKHPYIRVSFNGNDQEFPFYPSELELVTPEVDEETARQELVKAYRTWLGAQLERRVTEFEEALLVDLG